MKEWYAHIEQYLIEGFQLNDSGPYLYENCSQYDLLMIKEANAIFYYNVYVKKIIHFY